MAPGEEYVEISWQSRGNEGEHNARSCATERKPGGNHVGTVRESSENAPDALPGFSKTYRAPFACLPKASPCLPRAWFRGPRPPDAWCRGPRGRNHVLALRNDVQSMWNHVKTCGLRRNFMGNV